MKNTPYELGRRFGEGHFLPHAHSLYISNISVHAHRTPMRVLVNCTQPRHAKTFLTFFFKNIAQQHAQPLVNLEFLFQKISNTKMGFFANGGSTPLGIWDLQIPIALEI